MSNTLLSVRFATIVQSILITLLLSVCISICAPARADDAVAQRTFDSPQAAADALATAAAADDMAALHAILGSAADQLLSSGDPVADKNARGKFSARYREMHRTAYDDQGRVILYIGADNWPLPIPLIKKDGGWLFDTAAGQRELVYRRIGQNELFTIGVLDELVRAQFDYANQSFEGAGDKEFARRFHSDPGTHNGLYWPVTGDEPESPIGPLVASATAEGYQRDSGGNPIPFHGYYYRILTAQGPHAPGGAENYLVNGKMTRGFAFLAYPAEYRSSGVMTFMINQDGVVVQKDLGADTGRIASAISEFNPDSRWDQAVE